MWMKLSINNFQTNFGDQRLEYFQWISLGQKSLDLIDDQEVTIGLDDEMLLSGTKPMKPPLKTEDESHSLTGIYEVVNRSRHQHNFWHWNMRDWGLFSSS